VTGHAGPRVLTGERVGEDGLETLSDQAQELSRAQSALARRLHGLDHADLAGQRRAYDAFSEGDPLPPMAVESDVSLGGVSCLGLMAKGGRGSHVILWMHGGGFVLGSSRSHRGLAGQVAAQARCTAVIPDFRRAPEDRHPAAIEDGLAVYRALLKEGVDPANLIIAGDSAGGFLALSMALRLKSGGQRMPAALMFLSPWVDLSNRGWSHAAKAGRDVLLTRTGLDGRARMYLGDVHPGEEGTGLLQADLRDLPPAMIQVGEADILLSDSTMLAERLGAAGAPVSLEIWPHMFHVFQARYAVLGHARQAVQRLGAWAGAHFGA
jgi:epsilon-lactone hydrolase